MHCTRPISVTPMHGRYFSRMVYGAFQNGVRVEASSVYSTPYRFVKATPVRAPLNVQAENNTSYDKMPYFSRDTVPGHSNSEVIG